MGAKHRLPARQAGLIAALLVLASCSASDSDEDATPQSTTTTSTTVPARCSDVGAGDERVDIGDRWYQRHVPVDHDGTTSVPLVVDLHGYSEGALLHAERTGWDAKGDEEGFVTVTPQGLGEVPAWDLAPDGIDVAFVEDVIDDAEETLCIDQDRIYVTGHSMGGFLISTLACSDLATRVAAFGPVSGVREVEPCTPPRHAPAVVMHGQQDDVVLFEGGLSELAADVLDLPVDGPSIPAIVERWAARDPSVEVVLLPVEEGGHEWPAEATDTIWGFFEQHPRR